MPESQVVAAALEQSGKFRVERVITEGAQGYAFIGRHLPLDRPVFLKVTDYVEDEHERSLREPRMLVEALRSAASDNLVHLYDAEIVEIDDELFVCMQIELVSGSSLLGKLRDGPVGQQSAVVLGCGILAGVLRLHERSLAHRDLKPSNIMICDQTGRPKVADLGSIAHLGADGVVSSFSRHSFLYTPPEAFERNEFSASTDIYQVGMLLYEMANGPLSADEEHWITNATHRELRRSCRSLASIDRFDASRLVQDGIATRANRRALLEHGRSPLPVTSRALCRLIRAATAPEPTKRPTAFKFREKLASLDLPNWVKQDDAYLASNFRGKDVRLLQGSTGVVVERSSGGAGAFRKWNGSPVLEDWASAACWVERQSR